MADIKFGLKLWSTNVNVLKEAEELIEQGIFQYIELLVVPDTNAFIFQRLKVPYVIHVPHDRWGLNIAEGAKAKDNRKIVQDCIEWADTLNASSIVLHPGFGEIKEAVRFLEDFSDQRILIENMPKVGMQNEQMIGATAGEVQELMGNRFGFCLDFGHAVKAARSFGKDYKEYSKELLSLNPVLFHLSDGIVERERDEHLNIQEGNYDIAFLISCVRKNKNANVTLETPRIDTSSLKEDAANMRKVLAFL